MREQRLVFGEVADLYDLHRPTYPERLIDELVELAELDGREPVLEVGAGTAKATVMFAARGIPVVAVEPSSEMAAVAARNLRAYPGVKLESGDFEHWDPSGRRFPLVFSAQAWHWVRQPAGYEKAASVLSQRGILAAFWNRVVWDRSQLREPLLEAYERSAPDLKRTTPMHPANLRIDADDAWEGEIAGVEGLTDAELRYYEWEQDYSAEGYIGLLATTSDIRLLDEERRSALFSAVRAVIDREPGPLTLAMATRLCIARRV